MEDTKNEKIPKKDDPLRIIKERIRLDTEEMWRYESIEGQYFFLCLDHQPSHFRANLQKRIIQFHGVFFLLTAFF